MLPTRRVKAIKFPSLSPSENLELHLKSTELRTAKVAIASLEIDISRLTKELLPLFKKAQIDKFGGLILVEPMSLKINEGQLRKRVGARVWTKITKRVFDKALLDDAVVNGVVDPVLAAGCSEIVPSTPYFRRS